MNSSEENRQAPRVASTGRNIFLHIALTLCLFMSMVIMPVAGFLTGIFTPLPTALAFIRIGAPAAWIVPGIAGIAGGSVLIGLDMTQSLPYYLALLGMGAVLGYGIRKMWATEKAVSMACLVVVAMTALLFILSWTETGGQLVELLEQDLRGAITGMVEQIGPQSADVKAVQDSLLAAVPTVVRMMPGISIACTLGIALLNLLLVRGYCRAFALSDFVRDDLTRWKAPEPLVWAVIAGGIAVLLPVQDLRFPAVNLLVVLGSIYFLQGLSIASFFLDKWKLPALFRGLIYSILVLQQMASMVMAIVGLFDMWFDFRKMTKEPASP